MPSASKNLFRNRLRRGEMSQLAADKLQPIAEVVNVSTMDPVHEICVKVRRAVPGTCKAA